MIEENKTSLDTWLMETQVFAKCIIAGEHAVLRGVPALVFPVCARSLTLKYRASSISQEDVSVEFSGDHGAELRLLFWGVIERALELTGHSRQQLRGHFDIESTVPVGAGMGASAALCVGIGRWFLWKNWVNENDLPEFCRQLENLFHGESSGLDIAVAITAQGMHFERGGPRHSVVAQWKPNWFISYSGRRGVTSECIDRVKALWKRDVELGAKIDRDMREAVRLAEKALAATSSADGFDDLASAIHLARSCFEHWGLTGGEVGHHIQHLMQLGAYAAKPTGSGDGGYVLSLWRTPPPVALHAELVAL